MSRCMTCRMLLIILRQTRGVQPKFVSDPLSGCADCLTILLQNVRPVGYSGGFLQTEGIYNPWPLACVSRTQRLRRVAQAPTRHAEAGALRQYEKSARRQGTTNMTAASARRWSLRV